MPNQNQGDTRPKNVDLTPNNPHWICVESNALHWDLFYYLGDGDVTPSGGGGGWQIIERPDNVALVDWTGYEPWRIEVPIMLDGWIDPFDIYSKGRRKDPPKYLMGKGKKLRERRRKWKEHRENNRPENLEQHIELLVDLHRPAKHPPGGLRPRDEPPPMRVYGHALPFWLNGHRFVIENIEWGPKLLGPGENRKVRRQAVVVTFLQHVDEGYYKIRKRKKKKDGGKGNGGKGDGGKGHGGKGRGRRIVVREGEDAIRIAAREYGDPTLWPTICDHNDISNPRQLRVGQELYLP